MFHVEHVHSILQTELKFKRIERNMLEKFAFLGNPGFSTSQSVPRGTLLTLTKSGLLIDVATYEHESPLRIRNTNRWLPIPSLDSRYPHGIFRADP